MRKIARTLAVAGFVLVTAMPSFAQDTNTTHVKALIAQAMTQQGGAPTASGLPGVQETGPVIRLSVDEAVARAMEQEPHDRLRAADAADVGPVDRGDAGATTSRT